MAVVKRWCTPPQLDEESLVNEGLACDVGGAELASQLDEAVRQDVRQQRRREH
eukprot:CAMPEP_0202825336 /NCGR_PEP_ID=MMETSP1389-20130828/12971_1 /ASSEMBLY_ACC=CAM_ASM_000865 /TAXON_ID=302021 /ORGANISM="Rhodomonas sp., Strain CCMP768" /LENGTH=52 /DNA_ID=CAMNT_0049498549 /DNA_START=51 /DNA_END=207 /DNA_ORIENTATION=+